MNYYRRHIGDYMRDTANLTLVEHGAYTVLLDIYYASEKGIPHDAQLYKKLGVKTKIEKRAVDYILERFFTLKKGVWFNKRAHEEITKTKKKSLIAKINGSKGGRPISKKNNLSHEEKDQKPVKDNIHAGSDITKKKHNRLVLRYVEEPDGFQNKSKTKAYQQPIANSQEPINNNKQQPHLTYINNNVEKICVVLTSKGVVFHNCEQSKILDLLEKGATIHDFLDAAEIAKRKGKGTPYLLGIVSQKQKKSVPVQGLSLNSKNIRDGVNDDGSF